MERSRPRHILIKAPNWLGDVVLSLPALRSLRESFPGSEMCAVGNETALGALSLSGLGITLVRFDRHLRPHRGSADSKVHRARRIDIGDWAGHGGAAGPGRGRSGGSWLETLRVVRRHPWDLGVTFAESFSSALLLKLAGARRVVGYKTDFRGLLLTDSLPRERLGFRPHLVREYMALAAAAGASPGEETPALMVDQELAARADAMLSRAGVDLSKPLVGLCPGAAYGPSKRWPAERFSGVGMEMAADGAAVAVFGSSSETQTADAIARAVPGAVSLAGLTTVDQVAACFSRCALVIANDSGAAHLAAAVGTAVVAIFGSTDASWTRPLGAKVVVVRTTDIPCVPCFGKECDRGYACLTGISEQDVVAAARAVAGGALDRR